MKAVLPVAVCASLLVAGCSEKPQELLAGCYATGADEPVSLKVSEPQEGRFELLTRGKDGWLTPGTAMAPAGESLLKTALGDKPDSPAALAGLIDQAGTAAIFIVAEETKVNGAALDSRYLGRFFFGGGTVYKKACPES